MGVWGGGAGAGGGPGWLWGAGHLGCMFRVPAARCKSGQSEPRCAARPPAAQVLAASGDELQVVRGLDAAGQPQLGSLVDTAVYSK